MYIMANKSNNKQIPRWTNSNKVTVRSRPKLNLTRKKKILMNRRVNSLNDKKK